MSPILMTGTRHPHPKQPARSRAVAPWLLACAAGLWGCSGEIGLTSHDEWRAQARAANPSQPAAPSQLAQDVARDSASGDPLRGGRLYDKFYEENPGSNFEPDDPETPALDGSGGPAGDGTLRDGLGQRVDNQLGHNYRLKNFFGWDLRGAEGVYGPAYQDQSYVLDHNLLGERLTRLDVARLLVDGADGVPAYGEVLPREDLEDIVAFVMAVRDHQLPRPSDIWQLDAAAPKGYVLAAGANPANGLSTVQSSCGNCHGASGTNLLFDDGEHSLGTLARTSAYEVWFKIVAGNPGTPMGPQVPAGVSGAAQAQLVLDVLAALCDRGAFPRGEATEQDVSAGDPRCGSYLR